jgi:stage V sporulation protein B
MANYTKNVVRGAGYIFLFSILGSGFAYLARIFLARNLTTEEFGLFFAVFTVFSFLVLFRDLGLGQALVKYVSEFKAKKEFNKAKTVILLSILIQLSLALIVALILISFSGLLTKYYFRNDLAVPIIIILSIWFFIASLQGAIFQVFYGLKHFFLYSLKELRNFLYLILLIILFFFGFGILSPAYAWLISAIVIIPIFLPLLLRKFNFFKYKIVKKKELAKKLILFGLPVTLTLIGGKVIGNIDTLILTYFRSLSEVGIYNIILPTSLLLLLIGKSLGAVIFPIGSELWAKKENRKLILGLKLMHKYAFLAVVPLGLALISFAELFLRFLFGKEYVAGVLAFQILIIGTIFFIVGQINNSVISGIGKPGKVTKIILLAALINATMNFILIPAFGMEGAAVATTFSYILVCFISIREIIKIIGFKAPWVEWLKTILGGIIFVLTITVFRKLLILNPWLELFLVLIIAGVVYLIWLFATKIVTSKEIRSILRGVLKG